MRPSPLSSSPRARPNLTFPNRPRSSSRPRAASKGLGEDCTSIRGAQGVTCEGGACHVYTCQVGWQLDAGFRREKGGKGRCRKVRAAAPAAQHEVQEVVLGAQGLEKRDEGVSAAAVEAQ